VAHDQVRDVHVDMVRDLRGIGEHFDAVHDLLEQRTAQAHPFRNADEDQRHVDGDLLTGDELLEIHVHDLLLERVPLDLADQRLGGSAAERELDDGAGSDDVLQQLVEVAGDEREAGGFTGVAVDDAGNAAGRAQLAGDALAGLGARLGGECCGCHVNVLNETVLDCSEPRRRCYSQAAASALPCR